MEGIRVHRVNEWGHIDVTITVFLLIFLTGDNKCGNIWKDTNESGALKYQDNLLNFIN